MNKIDLIIKSYDCLHNRRWISPYFFTPFRRIVRYIANRKLPYLLMKDNNSVNKSTSDIIVSLTSFPARINNVHLVIRCLLRQTILPQKIILWLSKAQFEGATIPFNLEALRNDIFEIRFVEGDIRSHKKYAYVLNEYANNRVLIVDDDIYYPSDMMEKMERMANKYPKGIICRYGSLMHYDANKPKPYNSWWWDISDECHDPNFFFGSGGGILLKKSMLYQDVLNIEVALQLTPLADDIWLNAMVNLQGTKKHKIKCGLLLPIEEQQQITLTQENVGNKMNDIQFENIIKYYISKIDISPFRNISNKVRCNNR